MDSNGIDRQQRRLMRLRGAGGRDLGDVSFGFNFGGTPASARRPGSATKTPASTNPPQSRRSTIAKKTPRQASAQRTNRSATEELGGTNVESINKGLGTRSQKRKRGSDVANSQGQQNDELADESVVVSTKSRRTSASTKSRVNPVGAENSPTFITMDENTDSPSAITKFMVSPQVPRSNPRTPLVLIQGNLVACAISSEPRFGNAGSSGMRSTRNRTKSPMATIHEDEDGAADSDELSYESIEAIDLPDGTNVAEAPELMAAVPRRSDTFAPDLEGTRDDLTARAKASTAQRTSVSSRRRSTISKPKAPKSKRRSTAAISVALKPRKRTTKPSKPRTDGEPVQTVEVMVYRRSRKPAADSDPLGATAIPIVNAADVLSQILTEMGTKFIAKAAEKHTKKTFEKQFRYPLVSFMANLQDLLFDVSNTQNSVFALEGRMRSLKRQQADLRAELIRTKKQREDVTLDIDRVRSSHAARAKEEKEGNALHNMLHDLDVAIQRGRDRTQGMKEDDLQFDESDVLLHDVQQLMNGGGLIESVRDWNALLEKAPERLQMV